MNMSVHLLVVLLVIALSLRNVIGIPVSPCPQIFLYKFDQNLWHGEIHLTISPSEGRAMLRVRYSVAYAITREQKGEILFTSDKNDLEYSVNNNQPVKLIYKLTFPFQQVLPVIETITLNDQIACEGVPDPNRKIAVTFNHNVAWQPNPSHTALQKPAPAIQQIQKPIPTIIPPVTFPPSVQIPDKSHPSPISTPTGTEDVSQICGVPPKAIVQLIVNGEPAGPQPWLVSLYEGTRLNYEYFCAGNLISSRHVITAAHCVNGKQDIYMKLGAKSLTSKVEKNNKIRTNEKIYINEEYVHPGSHGDIAIILMNEPVTFASNIQPLCLWSSVSSETEIVGKIGIIVGWGKNENGDPEPDEPKKARVRVVTQQSCAQKDLLKNIISEKTFCAEGATHFAGPCLGDSGGALTMLINKRYAIRGIISATVGDQNSGICDVENYYSVYADVAKFTGWINDVLSRD